MELLFLQNCFGKLVMAFLFQCLRPATTGKHFQLRQFLLGTWPLLGFPILLFAFLHWRTRKTTRVLAERNIEEMQLVDIIQDAVLSYQLIRDYRKRFSVTDLFEQQVNRKNEAIVASDQVILNNLYYAKWLNKMFVVVYIILGGMEYVQTENLEDPGALSLGMFLATLRAYRNIGNAWCDIYESILRIEQVIPALKQFVIFLNQHSDLRSFAAHLKDRIQRTKEYVEKSPFGEGTSISIESLAEMLPITVNKPTITHTAPGRIRASELRYDGLLEIDQGKLVAFVGPNARGKTTLLRMMCSMVRPTDPQTVFVPSHLRVLNASFEAMFMRGTLLSNLTFGVMPDDPDGNKARVVKICDKIGLGKDVQTLVEKDHEAWAWEDLLSHTECFLLNIVRALVANPEVLCIHKPAVALDHELSTKVWAALQEFVKCRGVETDQT